MAMERPSCSIVIPVYGNAALTRQCLRTLLAEPPAVAHEIVVVDDASPDGTPAMLAGFGDTVRVVSLSRNQGFAAACNRGAAEARGDRLVFLNSDTVPRPGWLDALDEHARRHPRAGAVGAKLLYPDGSVQHAGIFIGLDRLPWNLYVGFPGDHPAVCRPRELQCVTGACFLIPRAVFDTVGGFDESFRNGYEDVDLCLRLRDDGFEVHYCPSCVVIHLEGASGAERQRATGDNRALYRGRWAHRVRPDAFDHYRADGLLRITYPDMYPLRIDVSPLVAGLEIDGERNEVDDLIADRTRRRNELREENTILRVAAAEAALRGERGRR